MDFPLKIVHRDEISARAAFSEFSPLDSTRIEGYAAKRDGRFQMLILRDVDEAFLAEFKRDCLSVPSVEAVIDITAEDFRAARSNSI